MARLKHAVFILRIFPLLLAGLMLGAGFLFGDGIISPAISVRLI